MLEPNLTKLNICPAGLLANVSIRTGEEQAKTPAPPGIQHKALCKAHGKAFFEP